MAEPDAILVCHRNASQVVKALVDGLKKDGRSISTGRERGEDPHRLLASVGGSNVALWTLKVGEAVKLPVGVVQVLVGEVTSAVGVRAIDFPLLVTASSDAQLLVTATSVQPD